MKAHSALIPLKSRLLLLPMILATTAAMGDALPPSSSTDGHAQAAALLSRPRSPDAALPHVLFLEDANGNAFQLMHSPGQGWKYLAAAKSEGVARTLSARKVDFSPVAASYAETTPPGADPMAVFIDGPTGYTFAWNADTGWKFVGHITEQRR